MKPESYCRHIGCGEEAEALLVNNGDRVYLAQVCHWHYAVLDGRILC